MQVSPRLLEVHLQLLANVVVPAPRRVALMVLAGLALSSSARAEEPGPVGISAEDFLVRVGSAHPRLALLEAEVERSAATLTATRLWSNPSLSYDREEVFAAGSGQPENYLRLELPIEISGRRGLRTQGAELGLKAARVASGRDRASLLFEALGTYWSASAARQTLELLQQQRESLGQLMEAVRSRTAAGDTSGCDLDRLELEADSLADLVADAERELDGWRRRLGLLLGAPTLRFEATEALVLPTEPAPLDGLLQQVLEARADYQAARLRVAQAQRELAAARRGWVPGLVLSGGMKSAPAASETAWGYLAGVSASLPVFDHGQGEAALARAGLAQAQAEQRLIGQQATAEVIAAHATLTRSLVQATIFERTQLPRLERLVRRAEVAYQEGERPVFELLDAYRTARGVRLRLVELKQKARLAELELSRAVGQPPGGAQ